MMLYLVGLTVSLLVIGFVSLVLKMRAITPRILFTREYLINLQFCGNNSGFGRIDMAKYNWLTLHARKIQKELGDEGLMTYYASFGRYIASDYNIIADMLPKLFIGNIHTADLVYAQDALIMHLGVLSELDSLYKTWMINPLRWLAEGANLIVTIPLVLIYWSGLANYRIVAKGVNSPLFRTLSILMSLILFLYGFLSNTMQIILSWDSFFSIIRSWLFK